MKKRTIKEISLLFSLILILVFGFVYISFSQEEENTGFLTMEISGKSKKTLTQDESKEGKAILIRLSSKHFDPLKELPVKKEGITSIQTYEKGETGYYIVQFDGPIET